MVGVNNMKMCVTGHRPNKLYGYDLTDDRWIALKEDFKQILIENKCDEAITGMTLGVDTIFAYAVLELKEDGHDIKLHCAVPCRNFSGKWNIYDRVKYRNIISLADTVKLVSDEEYKPYLMQKRNEYMVDHSDKVIAVWDGSKSGTKNCIDYAKKVGKDIIFVQP